MPTKDYQSKRDEIILDIAHKSGLIQRGKTISASTFPDAQKVIDHLISSERQKEREIVIDELLAAGMKMTFPNRRGIYILWWPDGFWDILLAAKRQQPSKKEME